jgi:hypothetical protein
MDLIAFLGGWLVPFRGLSRMCFRDLCREDYILLLRRG